MVLEKKTIVRMKVVYYMTQFMYTFISVAKCIKIVRPKGNHGMTLTVRYQLVLISS